MEDETKIYRTERKDSAMGMIFMPDERQRAKLIEEAWDAFYAKMNKAGFRPDEETTKMLKDVFVAGYCYGHNDTFVLMASQLNVEDDFKNFIKGLGKDEENLHSRKDGGEEAE